MVTLKILVYIIWIHFVPFLNNDLTRAYLTTFGKIPDFNPFIIQLIGAKI